MNNYNRNITMHCPICGNDQFSCVDLDLDDLSDAPDDTRIQCADCKTVFSKKELIDGNQDIINSNIEEVTQELIQDLEKKLKKALK